MSNFEVEVPSSFDSRRSFLATASGAIFNFMIVPRHVLGGAGFIAPSEMLNIAGIGAGGMGGGDIATIARLGANIVALCDVDDERSSRLVSSLSQARRYKDFRVMLDKEAKNICFLPLCREHDPEILVSPRLGKV